MNTYQHTSTENLIEMRKEAHNDSLALIWSNPAESDKLSKLVFAIDKELENRKFGLSKDLSQVEDTPDPKDLSQLPEEDQLMTIQIRFYHSGDYQNNQSEEYLKNGAFHGKYSTMFDAINELHRLDAYNLSVRQVGRFEYSENGQVSGWTYSSSTLTWGMRYWIVESDDTPEPKDLSQNALDYTLSYVECSACGHNSLKSKYVEDGRGFCVLCGGTIVGKFEKGTIEAEEIN